MDKQLHERPVHDKPLQLPYKKERYYRTGDRAHFEVILEEIEPACPLPYVRVTYFRLLPLPHVRVTCASSEATLV